MTRPPRVARRVAVTASLPCAFLCALAALAAAAHAGHAGADESSPAPSLAQAETHAARAERPTNAAEERITLTLQNASISDVVRAIAAHFELNLVMMGEDSRVVSVAFVDRTLEEALDEILMGSTLAYMRLDSTLRLMPGDLVTTQLFRVQHAPATRLASVVVQSAPQIVAVGDDASSTLSVTAPAKTLERVAALVRQADAEPQQVLIRARILEIGLTDETALGIDWEAVLRDGNVEVSATTALFPGQQPTTALEILWRSGDDQIDALVQHIAAHTNGRVLSSPEIVTMNREPAKILVGERVPYTKATTETQTGATLEQVEFVDVGVKLDVTPQVSSAGTVGLDISVETSEVLDRLVAGTPRIGTREAHTRVSLGDGETLLIGGLMREVARKERTGIPLLGDIPWLGRLFRSERTRLEETELVILLSPEVVSERHIADGRRRSDELGATAD